MKKSIERDTRNGCIAAGYRCFLLMCMVATMGLSCDKDSSPTDPGGATDPSENEFATVIITAIDEYGEPVEGVRVSVHIRAPYPPTNTDADSIFEAEDVTDENGILCLSDLMLGRCECETVPDGYEGSYNYIRYYKSLVCDAGDTLQATWVFPKDPVSLRINLSGQSYIGESREIFPLPDVALLLKGVNNSEYSGTSDNNGDILFSNIDPTFFAPGLTGTLQREESTRNVSFTSSFSYENEMLIYQLNTYGSADTPVIYTPEANAEFAGNHIHFSGHGYDFEDGELSDSSLVWLSSIDGNLGIGREITADLSVGIHRITLQAFDSTALSLGMNGIQTSIYITVTHYETESYFPFPSHGYWNYRLNPASFTMVNDWGETEQWTLDNMEVAVESYDTRVCTMTWDIDRNGAHAVCEYALEDKLDFDGLTFFVTTTQEQLSVYEEHDTTGTPIEELSITSNYMPSYPLLYDFRDPAAIGQTETEVAVKSSLNSTLNAVGWHTYLQNETITITYDPGSPVTLTTPLGTFETIPVIYRIGTSERTMYLAPGIGIVQLDIIMSGTPVTALLQETNMESYAPAPRIARGVHPFSQPTAVTLSSDEDRLVQVRRILRSLCPF